MKQTILVTGATGFTGRALCRRLCDDGDEVSAFVRASSDVKELVEWGVKPIVVDITSAESVMQAYEPRDRIFNIAAAFRTEHDSEDEFRKVNADATRHLLAAAKEKGVGRFVHCSTVGVQGEISDPPADEEAPFNPGDIYQQTKLEGELLAREAFKEGLAGTVVRPVGIHGPGDTRFLKLFKPISKRRFLMIGSGKSLYHMTYIDDLIDGFLLASEKEAALGEVFTIGGAAYTTLRELIDTIAEVLEVSPPHLRVPYWPVHLASVICPVVCKPFHIQPPIYPRRVEFFKKSRAFDISKAKRLLGYEPKVSLRDGLERTAKWYREQGLVAGKR